MILIIDTSQEKTYLALVKNGSIAAHEHWELSGVMSEMLLSRIDKLIDRAGILTKNLSQIFVCCGPGSYTGLRIGISTANFLAYSMNIPIAGYHTQNELKKLIDGCSQNRTRKFSKPVLPSYAKSPTITAPKTCWG